MINDQWNRCAVIQNHKTLTSYFIIRAKYVELGCQKTHKTQKIEHEQYVKLTSPAPIYLLDIKCEEVFYPMKLSIDGTI